MGEISRENDIVSARGVSGDGASDGENTQDDFCPPEEELAEQDLLSLGCAAALGGLPSLALYSRRAGEGEPPSDRSHQAGGEDDGDPACLPLPAVGLFATPIGDTGLLHVVTGTG